MLEVRCKGRRWEVLENNAPGNRFLGKASRELTEAASLASGFQARWRISLDVALIRSNVSVLQTHVKN